MKKNFFKLFLIFFILGIFQSPLNAKNILQLNNIMIKDVFFNCDKILKYPNQIRCYNFTFKEPVAALYYINKNVTKSIKKRLNFKEDKNIPKSFQNKLSCYVKSGFDRGHLASDADFDYNLTILKTTYFTSNIVPETPYLNRRLIAEAEKTERKFAVKLNGVYVLTGIIPSLQKLKKNKECANIPYLIYKIIISKQGKVIRIYIFKNRNMDNINTDVTKKLILRKLGIIIKKVN